MRSCCETVTPWAFLPRGTAKEQVPRSRRKFAWFGVKASFGCRSGRMDDWRLARAGKDGDVLGICLTGAQDDGQMQQMGRLTGVGQRTAK